MTDPIVTIKQGKIKGKTDTDIDGGQFYTFVGIPYAKPPVGPLRFKAPQTPEAWNEIRDCTKNEIDVGCLAYDHFTKVFTGSEDCLYVSVSTKQLPTPQSNPKPVMVFIHGGGFTMGSGSFQGPKHLLIEDIVVVIFSYRTGILGFLSSDDLSLDVPGNAGLKDQTFALKWVQENIASFNGDANNVTIFGISAGGASVSFQILSPSAKGLFHKAIVQSGTALASWAWGQKNAIQVAEKIKKKVSTDKEALDILMDTPAVELLTAALQIKDAFADASNRRPYGPVIEKPNAEAFLTENPFDLFASGRYNQVPIMQGFTSNEGVVSEAPQLGPPSTITPESGVIWYLGVQDDKEKSSKIAKLVEDFYFKDGITKDAIYKFISDVYFIHGAIESTKLISKTSAHPVYLYVYSRVVALSNMMRFILGITDDNVKGVAHGGDQMVLLSSGLIQLLGVELDEENRDAIKQLVKMWTDFARTGKPHPDWEPVTNGDNIKYFDIDKDLTLKVNPFEERFAFWQKIFEDAPNINLRINEQPQTQ